MKNRFIFIDADDTLWENEKFFGWARNKFIEALRKEISLLNPNSKFLDSEAIDKVLSKHQEDNIPLFGYGSKTLFIGMIDTATELCNGKLSQENYQNIKSIIKDLAYHEVNLFDGVKDALEELYNSGYKIVLATKGDCTEQNYKFRLSGLEKYFYAAEIMENKEVLNYKELCFKYKLDRSELIMVGNSMKSDIIPALEVGGRAIFIPYEIVWEHEMAEKPDSDRLYELESIKELPNFIKNLQ